MISPTICGEPDHADYILEVMGCGCAFFDYDNGWMDIFNANIVFALAASERKQNVQTRCFTTQFEWLNSRFGSTPRVTDQFLKSSTAT
ncbi:MAG TPA: hypothetical protein VGR84_10960 [Candidatus Acidoferrales bacterium]|nr:hypothetical protein [Candidatus Acidoferrales bacterium]